jgi:hypothetical protein
VGGSSYLFMMKDLILKILEEHKGSTKWTKDLVKKEAEKYKNRGDFQKNNSRAYKVAFDNGWLDEILPPQLIKWTKEDVLKLAKDFQRMNHFKKAQPKAYGAAKHNGWLDDLRNIFKPAYEKWTVERIRDIANKYESLQDFVKEQPKAYDAARSKGIYDEVTKHMERAFHFWSKDEIAQIASQYKYRKDFVEKSNNAYQAAVHNGWYDEVTQHMDFLGDLYKRMVYLYEFPDGAVYVGLTLSKERRNTQHLTDLSSPVFRYMSETKQTPSLRIVSDEYIDAESAQNLEKCTIEKFRLDNRNVLNKHKGGGLGSCTRIWTKDKVSEIALKFTKMNDFKKQANQAYQAAKRNGWLEEIRKKMKPAYQIKNVDDLITLMGDYNSMNDFRQNDYNYFQQAHRKLGNQFIKDFYQQKNQ